MITITGVDTLDLLRVVIAEHGATTIYQIPEIYDTCVYTVDGQPSCLVGHCLVKAGISAAALVDEDCTIDELELEHLRLTDGAVQVFLAAQEAQDAGEMWSEALRAAGVALDDWQGVS